MATATVLPANPSSNADTNTSCTTDMSGAIRSRFEDFEDLSRRLVMLPRVEDEGVGAVIASYASPVVVSEDTSSHDKGKSASVKPQSSSSLFPEFDDRRGKYSINSTRKEEKEILSTVSSDSTECRDENEDRFANKNHHHHDHTNSDNNSDINLVGRVLVGIISDSSDNEVENLRDADFATILSALRGQTGPILLVLEPSSDEMCSPQNEDGNILQLDKLSSLSAVEGETKEEGCHGAASDTDSTHEKAEDETFDGDTSLSQRSTSKGASITSTTSLSTTSNAASALNNSSLLSGRLSAWGSRMRASAQLAAETASSVAVQSLQSAAASRAAAATQSLENWTSSSKQQQSPPYVGLHVQTRSGAFLPLANNECSLNHSKQMPATTSASATKAVAMSPHLSELSVTTSSWLYIRKSSVEACLPKGHTYQWYKGLPSLTDKSSLDDDWISLPGSNSAAFQPSTTEVGFRLLCAVKVDPKVAATAAAVGLPPATLIGRYSDDSYSDDDSNPGDQLSASTAKTRRYPTIIKCVTPNVVAADLSLFNGARQALARGAIFGGLQGQGRARGRTFRVQVEMGNDGSKKTTSVVRIDQLCGETAEPIHLEPFYHVTAQTSHIDSKALELKFRVSDLVDNGNRTSILSALLSDDEGLLELVAPNRVARESLMLTIGIANFQGKPSDLDATTILYSTWSGGDDEAGETSSEEGSSSPPAASVSPPSKRSVTKDQEKGLQVVETLVLSPAESTGSGRRMNDASVALLSSAGYLSTIEPAFGAAIPISVQDTSQEREYQSVQGSIASTAWQAELEQEVAFLRTKLLAEDEVVSELQKHLARSDSALQQANQQVSHCQQQVKSLEAEVQSSKRIQKAAGQMVDQHLEVMKKTESKHWAQVSELKEKLDSQAATIADLEKTVKSHQNERAVLTAAIEARESKLGKMAELQESYTALSSKVSQQDQWKKELEETTHRYKELKGDLQRVTQLERQCRHERDSGKEALRSLNDELEISKDTATTFREELNSIRTKNQKLKSERNSYKQKADSLSKEISRICRNGRTLTDVERVLADVEARQEEVQLLRKQKRKALEECHSYRKSYEQSRTAQQLMMHATTNPTKKVDPNNSSALLLERNVELERLVTELTEYVNAKEMQLETMKQVNAALQEEIHGLAQANMHENEI